MSVRRIFVEKKPAYAVKAGELREELENYLGIHNVKNVRVLIRYDIENFLRTAGGLGLRGRIYQESGRPGVFRGISAGTV